VQFFHIFNMSHVVGRDHAPQYRRACVKGRSTRIGTSSVNKVLSEGGCQDQRTALQQHKMAARKSYGRRAFLISVALEMAALRRARWRQVALPMSRPIRSKPSPCFMDKVFAKLNGKAHRLCRTIDQGSEVLESVVTKGSDRNAALKLVEKFNEPI
jgi:transposase-like protein